MDDSTVRAVVQAEERSALGYLGGALSEARKKSMDYYFGEPFGNEIDGRSQVVSTDVADVIEWIMPSMMRIFAGGEDIAEFEASTPEDEPMAKQAADYCNWIFQKDNPGFVALHDAIKDALLLKTGILKVWWDPTPRYKTTHYQNLPDDSFALLKQNEDLGLIEIVSDEQTPDTVTANMAAAGMSPAGGAPSALQGSPPAPPPPGAPASPPGIESTGVPSNPAQDMAPPPAAPMPSDIGISISEQNQGPMLHNVEVRKTLANGRTCIEAVPPDEFLISRRARTVNESTYVGHRRLRLQSDLIEDGYDKAIVQTLGSEYEDRTGEQAKRFEDIDEQRIGSPSDGMDQSTREIWVTEHYIKLDRDGDGIAERLKIVTGGSSATLLTRDGDPDIEHWEGPVPLCVLTPILMQHRVIGRSMADLVMDLQLIKSTVLRQILDGNYLALNGRHVIDSAVEIDDMLVSRPGGIVRLKDGTEGAEGHVVPLETENVAAQAYPLMEYLDGIKEGRTGVTKYNQGLDANSLNKTATGITQIMTAAQQRIELVARVFAETGVKHLFKLILWNVCRYQDKPRLIKLRKEWVPMDPTEWDEEMGVTINVGLGTGNRDQVIGHLQLIAQAQQLIVQAQGGMDGPIVTAENIFATATKIAENAGFKNAEQFYTDPKGAPPKPPRPDPAMAKVQADAQAQQQKLQSDMQAQQAKMQMDAQQKQQETMFDQQTEQQRQQNDMAKTQAGFRMDQAKMEQEGLLRIEQMKQDSALRMQELQMEMQLKREQMQQELALSAQKINQEFSLKRESGNRDAELQARIAKVKNPAMDSEGAVLPDKDPTLDAITSLGDAIGKHHAQLHSAFDGHTRSLGHQIGEHLERHTTALVQTLKAPRKAKIVRDGGGKIVGAESVAE